MKKITLLLALIASNSISLFSQTVTFNYTGGLQTYTVPTCVFSLNVVLEGAEGGASGTEGGDGATVTGTIAVIPGQVLQIYVGGAGTITTGGFNGGGIGKPGGTGSGGGGGGSDIRVSPYALGNRVAVAGGGGGFGGGSTAALGGSGGDPNGTVGANAYGTGGTGATTLTGGLGGAAWGACGSAGTNGGLGFGGIGGTDNCYGLGPGGGGGGGLYGGGGGGADDFPSYPLGGGGGGGGSSLVPGGGTATLGTNTGNGQIVITPIGGGGGPLSVTPSAPSYCNGGSVVLTAATATTYAWAPATGLSGTTGATVTASPTVTTLYTVTGTTGACSTTVTVTVTVNPLPVATATPSTVSICDGATTSIALSSSIPGTTYAWTVAQSNVTGGSSSTGSTIAQTLSTTAPPSGTATYTITPTDPATGCVGTPITAVVTVEEPTISSIAITNVSCFGGSNGTITITAAGATQYSIDGGITYFASNVFTVAAGTYPVSIQTPGGCIATGTATVTQPAAALVAPMSFTDQTCVGMCDGIAGTAPSGGTSPYGYSWSTGITGTPFIGSLCSGTYTVIVTDNNGCTATGTTTVGGPVTVTITSVTPTQPLCNGGSTGQLVITASSGATGYSIDNGSTFFPSGTFTGLLAGTYFIEVQDVAGCNATTTVTINQPTPLIVTPSLAQTICFGQTATIVGTPSGATPPYTIGWTNPLGATIGSTSSIIVTPTIVGANIYTITVTDNNSCGPVTATVTITMTPPLTVVASADQTICPGLPASITTVTSSGGNGGPYTYTWSNSASGTLLFGPDQTVTPTSSPVTYTITLTDGCGTPAVTDQLIIDWFTLPAVTYTIDNNQGCTPVVVQFNSTTAAGASPIITWDFGDGGTGSGASVTNSFNAPTTSTCFDITLNITTTDGCLVDTTIIGQICSFPYPIPGFTYGPQPTDVFNPQVSFTNISIGATTYSWDFGGLGTSASSNPSFIFPDEVGGTYNVCLTTTTNQGCVASVCHDVVINDVFLIYVPNTFTPDGDGLNDIFLPILQGDDPAVYEFRIFNRWGETIFFTTDKLVGWDGTHKNLKAKEDVYVWKIKAKKGQNKDVYEKIGNINLLR